MILYYYWYCTIINTVLLLILYYYIGAAMSYSCTTTNLNALSIIIWPLHWSNSNSIWFQLCPTSWDLKFGWSYNQADNLSITFLWRSVVTFTVSIHSSILGSVILISFSKPIASQETNHNTCDCTCIILWTTHNTCDCTCIILWTTNNTCDCTCIILRTTYNMWLHFEPPALKA